MFVLPSIALRVSAFTLLPHEVAVELEWVSRLHELCKLINLRICVPRQKQVSLLLQLDLVGKSNRIDSAVRDVQHFCSVVLEGPVCEAH